MSMPNRSNDCVSALLWDSNDVDERDFRQRPEPALGVSVGLLLTPSASERTCSLGVAEALRARDAEEREEH